MIQQRYIFAVLATFGAFINLSGRNCLNLAVVAIANKAKNCSELSEQGARPLDMRPNVHEPEILKLAQRNVTLRVCESQTVAWTDDDVATILGAFFWGIFFSEVISGPIVDTIGGKKILLVANLLVGCLTLLIPYLVQTSLPLLVLSQIACGVANGVAVPSFHTLLGRWEPFSERGWIATIVYTGSPLSSIFCLLVTGYLTQYFSWKLPFYIFGSLAFFWVVVWSYFVYDSPSVHPRISDRELKLLTAETEISQTRPRFRDLPLRSILACPAVWAMVTANTAYTLAFSVTATQLPIMLDRIFHTSMSSNGLLNALPFLMNFIVSYVVTYALGELKKQGKITDEMSRKIATSLSLWGMAVFIGLVPVLGTTAELTTALVTIGYALTGAHLSGAWSNPLDIAPNFAATLMGLSGLFSYFVSSLLPLLYSRIITDRTTMEGWSPAIYLTVVIPAVANVVFLVFGRTAVEDWNYVERAVTADDDSSSSDSESGSSVAMIDCTRRLLYKPPASVVKHDC